MKIKTEVWLAWIGAIAVGTMALAAFAFTTFETKDHAEEVKQDTTSRLTRIEDKLDQALSRRR